jgi:hypothetical protein
LTPFRPRVYALGMSNAIRGEGQKSFWCRSREGRASSLLAAAAVVLLASRPPAAHADTFVVHAGESIQAAVDVAPAGSTILVEPGTYHEPSADRAVTITKDGIELIAESTRDAPVVLEGTAGQNDGIWVSPADSTDFVPPADDEHPPCGENGGRIHGSTVSGFTVTGFPEFGIYLACVDGFAVSRNTISKTLVYSIFPVHSFRGELLHNVASGTTDDACIYTGQDFDITVAYNRATDCLLGFQIENSRQVRLYGNVATGNTAGLFVDVIVNDQVKDGADNLVEGNLIQANNRPNTARPDTDNAGIPPGIGIAINGSDTTLVTRNTITDNEFAGVTISNLCIGGNVDCSQPLDVDPIPDGNQIVRNTIARNGAKPSGQFGGFAADVIYLADTPTQKSHGNCFQDNTPGLSVMPAMVLPSCYPRFLNRLPLRQN